MNLLIIFTGMKNMSCISFLGGVACVVSLALADATNDSFRDDQFWLSFKYQAVNWTNIIIDEAPFLNDDERDIILNDAFFESVNPLIIIGILSVQYDSHVDIHNGNVQQFSLIVKNMANSLVDNYKEYEDDNATDKTNVATSAIWESLDKDDNKLEMFLKIYNKLYAKHIGPFLTPLREEDRVDRDGFQMTWPWPDGESWNVGGTHGHGRVWSALDFHDNLGKCWWKKDRECIESTPLIYAMHSGTVSRATSKCNIRITHPSGWATNYYHMDDLKFENGDYVNNGEAIGRYAGDYETALCNGGRTTGPHLHLDLINGDGRHESLDGWSISGYKIKAGTKDYDENCKRCNFQKDGKTYCPYDSIPRDDAHHTCDSDSDCATGLICADGYCKECLTGGDCRKGQYCNDVGKCDNICEEVMVASSGPAVNVKRSAIGRFTKKGFRNGKMVYKNQNNKYLSFRKNHWIIQNRADFNKGNPNVLASTYCDETRPTDCTGPWRVVDDSTSVEWIEDSTINISCSEGGKITLD